MPVGFTKLFEDTIGLLWWNLLILQGSDFCSTVGFDVLVKRMKDGKQVCKEFEDFLKARYIFLSHR